MRATPANRLPIGDFFTQHLGTPTAGSGTADRLELVRMRRVQIAGGAWGWAKRTVPGANRRSSGAGQRQLR